MRNVTICQVDRISILIPVLLSLPPMLTDMLAYINWDPDPIAFDAGFLQIRWYGITWFISFLIPYFVGSWMFKREGKDVDKLSDIILWLFVGALVGARMGEVIFYHPAHYFINPVEILYLWDGGLASHGGIIGMSIAGWMYCNRHKDIKWLWLADRTAILFMPAGFFIRFGNLLNSELVGKPTDVDWAFIFHQVDQVPRHPVVLYESLFYAFCGVVMLILYTKMKDYKPGIFLGSIFTIAFTVRFLLEFLKVSDSMYVELIGISNTQLLNLPFIIIGAILTYLAWKGKFKFKEEESHSFNTPTSTPEGESME